MEVNFGDILAMPTSTAMPEVLTSYLRPEPKSRRGVEASSGWQSGKLWREMRWLVCLIEKGIFKQMERSVHKEN